MKKTFNYITSFSSTLSHHFISAFLGGIFGFILFFLIIMIVKTVSFWLGIVSHVKIESEDILLSVIGLILMALIKILEDLRLKDPLS